MLLYAKDIALDCKYMIFNNILFPKSVKRKKITLLTNNFLQQIKETKWKENWNEGHWFQNVIKYSNP